MSGQAVAKKLQTYVDYLRTPEEERWELIEGELLMTPSPIPRHQSVSSNIFLPLKLFVRKHHLGEVFYAPLDVHLDQYNCLQPDILYVSKKRLTIITEKNIKGAPDLVIEVVSDSSAYHDLVQKKRLYAKFGVREYWIVLPAEATIEVYILKNRHFEKWKEFRKEDRLTSHILEGFKLRVAEVF